MACSQCCGVEQQFNQTEAERALRRYRRRGPDRTTRILIDDLRAALGAASARDLVLLDVGAGIGAIHHELLDGSVSRAIHVDASSAHITAARAEAERRNHSARVDFLRANFVELADTVPTADLVTLDRVICCYDDMNGLVTSAASKATRIFGAVYPRQNTWMRVGITVINLIQRVRRSAFRVFLHDPSSIDRVLRDAGMRRSSVRRTLAWEVVVYARSPG